LSETRYGWLKDKVREAGADAAARKTWRFEATFFEPAREEQIEHCERALSFELPPSYRDFVRVTNGAVFTFLEPVMDVVVPVAHSIDSLQQMERFTSQRRIEKYHDWDRLVHVGFHNEGDDILFDVLARSAAGECAIFDSGWFPYKGLDEHESASFEDHLRRFLESVIALP
jgi:hypothetical protein